MKIFSVLPLCLAVVLTACDSGGGRSDVNTDSLPSDSINVLNGVYTGGSASVVLITAYAAGVEKSELVFINELALDCSNNWVPQGSLCDVAPTTNSSEVSTKIDEFDVGNERSGATWDSYDNEEIPNAATGVLIVDACSDNSCDTVSFTQARVFQMFSDGKTTHIQLAVHNDQGDNIPAWDDEGWTVVSNGFESIGAGMTSDDGETVSDPTAIALGSWQSRYVRIEARNDGSYGGSNYIELRSIKLF